MKLSIQTVIFVTVCVAHVVIGDLSEQRVSDAWADFYKSYYEQNSGSEDNNDRDFHAPATSYDSPTFHSHGSSYHTSPSYSSYPYSYGGLKSFDLFSGDTSLVIGSAGLLAGLIAIAVLVLHSNELQSICETGKNIGNINLAATAAAGPADAAATAVELNRIITAINAVPTPDCRD